MSLRFRRSFRVAPGLRINVSKSGVSEPIGRRGERVTMVPRSTRTTVGIPRTGISYGEQTPRTPVRQGHPKTGGIVGAIALTAFVLLAIALA